MLITLFLFFFSFCVIVIKDMRSRFAFRTNLAVASAIYANMYKHSKFKQTKYSYATHTMVMANVYLTFNAPI